MINVTKPSLPDLKEYVTFLKKLWKTKWITNNGEYVLQLEQKLETFLGVKDLVLVSNGTMALHLALKSLSLRGEVITTPYTFISTTNAILWEGLKPVFADIDHATFNIDPEEVKKKITKKTSAILAVHVYGNPCQTDELKELANENKIALIFDGAHSFGVKHKNRSIFSYGDISTLSFHATKIFNTIEGGAIVTNRKLAQKIRWMSDHGIKSEVKVTGVGINAKMNEFQAAMGLCNLKRVKAEIELRKRLYNLYKARLSRCGEIEFQKIVSSKYNYSYMPVLFKNIKIREKVRRKLLENGINARRYFYPLATHNANSRLGTKPLVKKYHLDQALNVSERVLCLPLYPDLPKEDVNRISEIIEYALND